MNTNGTTTTASTTTNNATSTMTPTTSTTYSNLSQLLGGTGGLRQNMIPQQRALKLLQYYAYRYEVQSCTLMVLTLSLFLQYNNSALSHSIDTMLLACSFQGDNCTMANFTSWDHSTFGRCHTIVPDTSYPSIIGLNNGLSITLNVESEEYLDLISTALGFQVCLMIGDYIVHRIGVDTSGYLHAIS
jgi:hypothetical protein